MYKAIFTYHKFHGDPSQLRFHFNKASDVSSCSHQIFCHGTSCILYKGYKFVNIKNAYNLIFFAHFFNISFEFFSLSLHGSKTNWQRYKKQDDTYEISLSNSRIDLFINLWFSRIISFSGFWEKTFPILIWCLKYVLMCRRCIDQSAWTNLPEIYCRLYGHYFVWLAARQTLFAALWGNVGHVC